MSIYDFSIKDIQSQFDVEPYRSRQIYELMYRHLGDFSKATGLPKSLVAKLIDCEDFQNSLNIGKISKCDNDQTEKFLFELKDKKVVESVLMHYYNRSSVCISTQSGCKMNCSFCATGQMGFKRNLSKGEIVEQVIRLMRYCIDNGHRPITNIVFMGMGEPLDNYENSIEAAWAFKNELNIGAKHITVSTVGIVPAIKRLTEENLPFRLAVSLHGSDNETRSKIVPINKKYPLEMLIESLTEYLESNRSRRLSLEWTLIKNVNDTQDQAVKLAKIAKKLRAHVNLIYLNPTAKIGYNASQTDAAVNFKSILENLNINVTLRKTRGQSINAACGQLAYMN